MIGKRFWFVLCMGLSVLCCAREKLAVVDFAEQGEIKSHQAGQIVANLFGAALSDKYTLLERMQINKIIAEQRFSVSDLVSNNNEASKLGKLLGADKLVVGNVAALGDTITVDARVVDVSSGEWSERAYIYCSGLGEIPKNLPTLLSKMKLLGDGGVSAPMPTHASGPLSMRDQTFSSLLSRAYAALKSNDFDQAEKLAKEASEIPGYKDNQDISYLLMQIKQQRNEYMNQNNKDKNMTIPGLNMQFVYVAPGSFQMGSNDGENDEKPAHSVTISNGYWIGKYEVTQSEYQSVMGNNPSDCKGGNKPVQNVNWHDAGSFCQKLTERERAAGRLPPGYEYRLPTEAEWEFAARGGNQNKGYKYSGSDNLDNVAWYDSNSGNQTYEVGAKSANELGIYDMSGNVWEWCLDNCNYNSGVITDTYRDGVVDPLCRIGSYRVNRGGSWGGGAGGCRVANRNYDLPAFRFYRLGFRVAVACSSK